MYFYKIATCRIETRKTITHYYNRKSLSFSTTLLTPVKNQTKAAITNVLSPLSIQYRYIYRYKIVGFNVKRDGYSLNKYK